MAQSYPNDKEIYYIPADENAAAPYSIEQKEEEERKDREAYRKFIEKRYKARKEVLSKRDPTAPPNYPPPEESPFDREGDPPKQP